MIENQKIRPAQVIGPLGEPLTIESLPPANTRRWVVRRKAEVVAAVNGGLQLVPMGKGRTALAEDYDRMVEDGLLLEDAEPFEVLMARCTDIAERSVIAHQAERER